MSNPTLLTCDATRRASAPTSRSLRVVDLGKANGGRSRYGVALLLTLFVLSIVTVWLVGMLDSATIYQSALRNTIEYEQAIYLANAGVHHAVAVLESDDDWLGTVSNGSYPGSGSYSATAVAGVTPGTVDITSTGVAGSVVRRLSAVVQLN